MFLILMIKASELIDRTTENNFDCGHFFQVAQ